LTIVRAFPRIHVALADLGRATARAYGGAGFALQGPALAVSAVSSDEQSLIGFDSLDEQAYREVQDALARLEAHVGRGMPYEFALQGPVRQHIGLGTKTALILATLQAAALASGHELPMSVLQLLSGRGGASGVGINTFFTGGFVIDSGHRQGSVPDLFPSSARTPSEIPPVTARLFMPPTWRFRIFLPPGRRVSGQEEKDFFESVIPVARAEVLETIALLFNGLAPAVATEDLGAFATCLLALHQTGFKKRELGAQTEEVRGLLAEASTLGPAGLSSLGPLVYTVHAEGEIPDGLDQMAERFKAEDLGTWAARDNGFEAIDE
jgi:beta-ribofuranosylaminobenzene 5'-phosphate synthase